MAGYTTRRHHVDGFGLRGHLGILAISMHGLSLRLAA